MDPAQPPPTPCRRRSSRASSTRSRAPPLGLLRGEARPTAELTQRGRTVSKSSLRACLGGGDPRIAWKSPLYTVAGRTLARKTHTVRTMSSRSFAAGDHGRTADQRVVHMGPGLLPWILGRRCFTPLSCRPKLKKRSNSSLRPSGCGQHRAERYTS